MAGLLGLTGGFVILLLARFPSSCLMRPSDIAEIHLGVDSMRQRDQHFTHTHESQLCLNPKP